MGKTRSDLSELRHNLRAWARTRLWAQVLIGLVLGIGVGAILGPDLELVSEESGAIIGPWLAIPGRVFLGLISLVLVPLVFVSIVQGITGSSDAKSLRNLGGRLLIFVILTTTAAATLGVVLANALNPGSILRDSGAFAAAPGEVQTESSSVPGEQPPEAVGQRLLRALPDMIVDLLPTNVQAVLSKRDMLAIVIIAVLFGLASRLVSADRIKPVLDVLSGLLELSMIVVKWAMFLAPLAVFGLIAQLVIQVGLGTIGSLAAYAGAVLLGLAILYVLFIALIGLLSRGKMVDFVKSIAPVQLMAFSTSSTAAVMPLSIHTAVSKLGVRPGSANLIIPLAATINMAGTALYQSIAIMFLAQAAGLELSLGITVGVVISVVAASVGAPGTPGVGVVILSNIAASAGIPATGLPLVLGLDRPLDMARTAVNVTGDLTACVLVDQADSGS